MAVASVIALGLLATGCAGSATTASGGDPVGTVSRANKNVIEISE